jgi:hypothetical protein
MLSIPIRLWAFAISQFYMIRSLRQKAIESRSAVRGVFLVLQRSISQLIVLRALEVRHSLGEREYHIVVHTGSYHYRHSFHD